MATTWHTTIVQVISASDVTALTATLQALEDASHTIKFVLPHGEHDRMILSTTA